MGKRNKKEKKQIDPQALQRLNNGTLKDLRHFYKKLIEDLEAEEKETYNVCLYEVRPYPPGTKNFKDFFIQRTDLV
jgi:hypothetical protein